MPFGISQLTGFNKAAVAAEPTSFDDPDLWLYVTSDYGVTTEGITNKVYGADCWLDKSAGARHLSSVVERFVRLDEAPAHPMPTGKPVILFNPADPATTVPSLWTPQAGPKADMAAGHSVYMLIYVESWQYPKYFFDGGAANSSGISMQPNTNGRVSLSAPSLAPTIANMVYGQWMVLTAIFNGGSSVLQANHLTEATGNPGTTVPNWAWIGGITTVGAYHAQFDCGGVIISNSVNDAATRALHQKTLADYAGISLD